jgi:hypothetical protein
MNWGLAQIPTDVRQALETADQRVVRLSPAAFPDLPKNLLADLNRRGCLIPQVLPAKQRHNVIKVSFPSEVRQTGQSSAQSEGSPRSWFFGTVQRATRHESPKQTTSIFFKIPVPVSLTRGKSRPSTAPTSFGIMMLTEARNPRQ